MKSMLSSRAKPIMALTIAVDRKPLSGPSEFDLQQVARFCRSSCNCICGELEHAFCAKIRPNDREGRNGLAQADDCSVLAQHHHVNRKTHSQRMDRIAWDNPDPASRFNKSPAEQPDKARESRVRNFHAGSQKRPFGAVENAHAAFRSCGHSSP